MIGYGGNIGKKEKLEKIITGVSRPVKIFILYLFVFGRKNSEKNFEIY